MRLYKTIYVETVEEAERVDAILQQVGVDRDVDWEECEEDEEDPEGGGSG